MPGPRHGNGAEGGWVKSAPKNRTCPHPKPGWASSVAELDHNTRGGRNKVEFFIEVVYIYIQDILIEITC
jgi:hypothetical protein